MTSLNGSGQAALAQRLRETRELLNVSQKFVSEQTGISRGAVSDIERGVRKVDALELKRLAELYRFPVAYFLGDENERIESETGSEAELSALLRTASALSGEDRQQMLRFGKFLRGYDAAAEPTSERSEEAGSEA